VAQNFSLHENWRDDEPVEIGSPRSFGCTTGAILIVIGVVRAFMAGTVFPISWLLLAAGVALLLFGIAAPARLSTLNRAASKLGAVIARAVNPIVLALLFFCVVTPMGLIIRMIDKRPLNLKRDPTAGTYWIKRELVESGASSMRRQF
jgi:hypothetical protein